MFESDLSGVPNWTQMLHAASIDPPAGVAWNLYWGLHLIPDGADRATAVKAGGAPLALHIDIDQGDANAILSAFCAKTGIPREALDIVTTGTKPNLRMQVFLRREPLPDQLERLKDLAKEIGADPQVYSPAQLLRLVGSIAQPWKGGDHQTDRMAELVTLAPATAAYAGPVNMPPKPAKTPLPRPDSFVQTLR